MKIKSIRWRLSLSYAAIALLAALLLGVILVWILFNFYSRQEQAYLERNADSLGALLALVSRDEMPQHILQNLVESTAFISNTQVRLLSEDRSVVVDSGLPQERTTIAFEGVPLDGLALSRNVPNFSVYFSDPVDFHYIGEAATPGDVVISEAPIFIEAVDAGPIGAWTIAAPMGELTTPVDPQWSGARSRQSVQRPYFDPAGVLLGYVELSNGPAYGREILKSVVLGWGIAGGLAVILAAATGWLLSRSFSAPLAALAQVTTRMTDGDLSVRADVLQQDEFGKLAQSFNHMAASVESKVETMRRFVADAAHEIYTPLAALRGSLELAEFEQGHTDQSKHLDQAQAQVTRMDALTSGLLDLSRLETEAEDIQFSWVDLKELLPSLVEPFASRAEQAGVDFVVEVDEEVPNVWGDASQLGTLIHNLLDNAVKFTPQGGRVVVSLQRSADSLQLIVTDTGMGIPIDDQQQLFGRFHRGNNTAAYPGSGLGLAIVKTIADLHQAIVDVKSSEDGTEVRVQFVTP